MADHALKAYPEFNVRRLQRAAMRDEYERKWDNGREIDILRELPEEVEQETVVMVKKMDRIWYGLEG
jgi:hypothetical protein